MSLLSVGHLSVRFKQHHQDLTALFDISFSIQPGERVAVVGESGAGKSVLGYAIANLLPEQGYIACGSVRFGDQELRSLSRREWRKIRGHRIAMIFQDMMMSLNPVLTIGDQMVEAIRSHSKISFHQARQQAIDTLHQVRIRTPEQCFYQYPHQLSGGMRQRVIIAIVLLLKPELIIADEPTTALDVTLQAEILHLLKEICEQHQVALLFISHDFGVISRICERTLVMYAGKIVEQGPTLGIINDPQHPYTQGLINALPQMALPGQPLNQISGNMPSLTARPSGCAFHPRCPYALPECRYLTPDFFYTGVSATACFVVERIQTVNADSEVDHGTDI
ncbi:ABC transporter ATP-binding protein [Vibrio quintilis]|uniref:ABC-type dipeptide transporter n=1 Tax=Vibrio quintilis TaxID=1117707 RepID=A0A1M7YRB0_9VIBR|nr:ABC transporter ATP-binding protein [Vibrio quintilis]SHO55148.1 Oligopeptide transport ATP-binding protein OppD [Vibrio quintilis]